jgi:hypothetical protein
MACEAQQQRLKGLQEERADVEKQLQQPNIPPAERSRLLQELKALGPAISAAQTALKQCQDQQHPPPPPTLAPASILTITPVFPDTVPNMIAKRDGYLNSIPGKKFPQDVGREWAQPLAPNDDYDDLVVSCSGWMVHPRDVGGDFPFSHPFGIDWEFSLALDKPANAAGPFDYLLTTGNKVDASKFPPSEQSEQATDETRAHAMKLDFPLGLLGIEMDGGLVPTQFKQGVAEGHRAAVFGRWIIDTGHIMHRGEIHPPLLMAAASVTAPDTTKAIFTSRPYLVSQLYTTDQGSVYKDSGGNDGTFYSHLLTEIIKINEFRSTLIECHPKVTENPMRGVHLLRCQVRPPTGPGVVTTALKHLVVSFHFTIRTGVAVQVISSGPDTIEVFIVLNSAGYKAPPLPHNAGHRYSQSELSASNQEVGNDYLKVEALSAAIHLLLPGSIIGSAVIAGFLARGVQGDLYDPQNDKVNVLATQGAVLNVPATNIPPNAGITVDDNQPYPITGWIEAKWVASTVVAQPITS